MFLIFIRNTNSVVLAREPDSARSGIERAAAAYLNDFAKMRSLGGLYILSYHSQFSYYSTNSRLRLMRWTNFTEVKTTRQGYEAISPTGAEFADNFWLSWDERGPAHSIPFDTDSHHASVPPRFSADGRYLARTTLEGVILLVHREEVRRRFATLGFKVRP